MGRETGVDGSCRASEKGHHGPWLSPRPAGTLILRSNATFGTGARPRPATELRSSFARRGRGQARARNLVLASQTVGCVRETATIDSVKILYIALYFARTYGFYAKTCKSGPSDHQQLESRSLQWARTSHLIRRPDQAGVHVPCEIKRSDAASASWFSQLPSRWVSFNRIGPWPRRAATGICRTARNATLGI